MAQTGYTPILIYASSTGGNAPAAGNLTNSTLGSELAINITDGKLFYKDNANAVQVIGWKVVPTSAGGTGLTSFTAGDMMYYSSGTAFSLLSIGTADYVMTSSGTAPQWSQFVKAKSGGTGQTSYAIGDILYADTTTTLAKLADVATGNALISGGVGVAPSWGKIGLTTHVSGTLPIANGGTNQTSFTGKSGNICGLIFFDGTSFQNDATVSHVGYDTVANTFYANNVNFSGTVTLTTALPVGQGGTGTSTAFTAGSVVFAGTSGVYSQNNANFFWDNTNNRLGIGTATPGGDLTVNAAIGSGTLSLTSSTTPTGDQRLFLFGAGSVTDTLKARVSFHASTSWTNNTSTPTYISFLTTPSGSTTATERARIDSSGQVSIGTATARSPLTVVGNITLGATPGAAVAGTDYQIIGNSAVSGSANGGALTILAGAGSGVATNGSLYLQAGLTASQFSATTGGSVYIDTGKPSDSLAGGSHYLRRYTGNPSAITTTAVWDASGYYTCLGVYNATVGATNRDVYVDSTGLVGYVSSTRESKKNIVPMDDVSWLMQLQPVTFNRRKKQKVYGDPIEGTDICPEIGEEYTDDVYDETEYGLIADDTEPVNADLCFYDDTETGKKLAGIQYSKLVTPMLKKIQQQQQSIDYLIDEIQKLKGQK